MEEEKELVRLSKTIAAKFFSRASQQSPTTKCQLSDGCLLVNSCKGKRVRNTDRFLVLYLLPYVFLTFIHSFSSSEFLYSITAENQLTF